MTFIGSFIKYDKLMFTFQIILLILFKIHLLIDMQFDCCCSWARTSCGDLLVCD